MRKSTLEKLTEFGIELNKLRLDLRITQQQMAADLNFKHSSTLSEIELGKQPIIHGLVNNIAKTYNLSVADRLKLKRAATMSTPCLTFDMTTLSFDQRHRVMELYEEIGESIASSGNIKPTSGVSPALNGHALSA